MNLQLALYNIILPMKKIIVRYAVAIDYFTHKRGVETVATERDPVFPATRLACDPSL